MSYYIISDQHFGAWAKRDEPRITQLEQFVTFLLQQDNPTLVIAGDFFDFWISYRDLVRTEYLPILFQLKRLTEASIPVIYIRGNHDFMNMDLLHTLYGITVVDTQYLLHVNNALIAIEHGDRVKFSVKHSVVNRILWSPFAQFLYRLLPPDWAIPFALQVAHLSRKKNCASSQDEETSALYQQILRSRHKDQGVSVSIIGHVHYKALEKDADGWIYANAGTWLKAPTFLRVEDTSIALCEVGDEGACTVLRQEQIRQLK